MGKAHRGLAFIQKLYRIERQARGFIPAQRYRHRQQHAHPLLDKLRVWLDEALPQVPPTSTTGKALNYLHNEWQKLIRYLDDGRLEIDNNGAENAIRPLRVGPQELAIQCLGQGCEGQRQSILADRDRQSEQTGALCLSPVSVHGTAEGRNS
ncbi:MAG: IS66 family transposase [Candidatus Thiodiazotropha sp. (ex Dulcina madagascariensis)]|nr:IS66 family transposase [Candidatus Thiodiazotropha sp. (ex Dulcina madagascariensis)]